MQAGRRRRAPRPVAAHAPRVIGLLLAVLLALSAVPTALACCRPGHPPRPPGGFGRADATFAAAAVTDGRVRSAVSGPRSSGFRSSGFRSSGFGSSGFGSSAFEPATFGSSGFEVSGSGPRAGQPRCSDDPLDVQAPLIEASDSRPVHSAANADGSPASGLPVGAPAGRASRPTTDARGGAGPPLWLRTCVSRT
jgi:hypothetical protein